LLAIKNANDPTWVNLKADADTYATYKVPAYSRNSCPANNICYDYQGLGWMNAIEPLALAYHLTSDTKYSDKVREILNAFAAAGVAPCSTASGYASRSAVFGMGLGYDWVYDQLTPAEKTNLATELNSCWDWLQTSGYEWNCSSGCPTAYGNYYGGHILGYGLAAIAMEGDNTNAPTILSAVTGSVNKYLGSSIGPPSAVGHADPEPGGFAGGFAVEGYNYGGSVFLRYIQFFQAMETAGKADLFTQYLPWMKQVAKNTVYEVRPDNWAVNDEGEWSGPNVRVLYSFFPCDLGAILADTSEGGWMTYLCQHLDRNHGSSGVSPGFGIASHFEKFFYNAASSGTNYFTLPLNFFSPGDYHTIVRSDWTTSAVHTTVDSISQHWADHQSNMAGHVAIQRGSDYLLVNAGMWAGQNGAVSLETGTWPQTDNPYSNWDRNTLFYWDGGAAVHGVSGCLVQDYQYAGCQGFWGVYSPVIPPTHKEDTGWTFQRADLTRAYNNNNGLTTITQYVRSFINIGGDISFVLDRITAPANSTRQLRWHTPALSTATPSGIATAITVGPTSSVTVGSSTLWINTMLPPSPAVKNETDELIWGSGKYSTTQEFIVSDPFASRCSINCLFLTVFAPTASSVNAMPTTTLISTTGYKGAIYNDGVLPRIALFSADGTSKKEVTYTASYSSELNGRHVITDLISGTYTVSRDGAIVLTDQVVGTDGSLTFVTTGCTTYSITYTGKLTTLSPPTELSVTVH
jgi:hypothetical protein